MKITCIALLMILLPHASFSQMENLHQLGGKNFIYGNTDKRTSVAFVYTFRKNIVNNYQSSFSAGTHLSLGFSDLFARKNIYSTLLLDIPLVLEYNIGYGSTKRAIHNFGGYLGAGYALHKSALPDVYKKSTWLHGPVLTAGLRFKFLDIAPINLGVSYMPDKTKNETKTNIFGISVSYMFGL